MSRNYTLYEETSFSSTGRGLRSNEVNYNTYGGLLYDLSWRRTKRDFLHNLIVWYVSTINFHKLHKNMVL